MSIENKIHGVINALDGLKGDGSQITNLPAGGLSDYFDVTTFGADPTGNSDSTAGINAAITAANGILGGNSGVSGTVYIPSGIYYVPGAINNLGHASLIGQGMRNTQLFFTTQSGRWLIPQIQGGGEISGIYFNASDGSGLGVLQISSGEAITIRNCTIANGDNNMGPAVNIGSTDVWFIDNYLQNYAINSSTLGIIQLNSGAGTQQTIINGIIFDNCQANAISSSALISVAAGETNFSITGCLSLGSTFNYGTNIATGSSDHYIINANEFSNATTAKVLDGGSGTFKLVANNPT